MTAWGDLAHPHPTHTKLYSAFIITKGLYDEERQAGSTRRRNYNLRQLGFSYNRTPSCYWAWTWWGSRMSGDPW